MSNANISKSKPLPAELLASNPAATTYDPNASSATTPIKGASLDRLLLPKLGYNAKTELDEILKDEYERKDLPGVFLGATNAEGILYLNQLGKVDFGAADDGARMIDDETILHIFSMTKFIGSLCALQVVEKGLWTLDQPVDDLLPEIALGKLQILKGYKGEGKGQEIWEEAKSKITLRMLLTHNAGMGYPFTFPELGRWNQENGKSMFFRTNATVDNYVQPLAYNPGSSWRYSIGIDWAGILVERLTKQSLEDYMKENIFGPCGMTSTTFYPYDWVKERLMQTCIRGDDRELKAIPGMPMGKPDKPEDIGQIGAGGGLYGTVKDYLRLIQNVLASHPANPSPSAKPFLSPYIFKEIFTGCLPEGESGSNIPSPKEGLAAFMKSEAYPSPTPTAETVNHSCGLSLNLVDSKWGRKAGSGTWAGAAKSQFWIDPTTGIGGVCATQLFAPNPDEWTACYNRFESTLYSNLEAGPSKI